LRKIKLVYFMYC